jgi:hypothetical protein
MKRWTALAILGASFYAHCSFALDTIIILPQGETNPVTAKFQWSNSIIVSISGGSLIKPFRLTFNETLSFGDKKITKESSKELFDGLVAVLYQKALADSLISSIFEYMIEHEILSQYVYLKDRAQNIDAAIDITIMHKIIRIKFSDVNTKRMLGTAIIDKNSYKVNWISYQD